MTIAAGRHATEEEIATYRAHGVVCLRQALPAEWLDVLRETMSELERTWRERKAAGRAAEMPSMSPGPEDVAVFSLNNWEADKVLSEQEVESEGGDFIVSALLINNPNFPGVRRLAFESPLPRLMGELFGSSKVLFGMDQEFIKEPGASRRTAFHQDEPYFNVSGEHCASVWIAPEPVDERNGRMGYVRGSHRWATHAANRFISQEKIFPDEFDKLPQLPDIEGNEDDFDIVYYDVEPGDAIVHHYRLVHGARGNVDATRGRRALSLRYTGDDAYYLLRGPQYPMDPTLKDGDPLDSETFPIVWRASAS